MESLTLTVEETAKLLRISRNSAYTLAREGKLPVLRLGRRLLVSRKGLDELLNASTRTDELRGGHGSL
jgi:excisionase family DNA binding protein